MRPSHRPRALVALPALLVALLVAGCSTDGQPSATVTDPAAGASAPTNTAPGVQLRRVETTATSTGEGAPDPDEQTRLDSFSCADKIPTSQAEDEMLACDNDLLVYLLEPAAVDGGVQSATAEPGEDGDYDVVITFGPDSRQKLAELTGQLVGTPDEVAVVFEGRVLFATTISNRIDDGVITISNSLDQEQATALAEQIQAGA